MTGFQKGTNDRPQNEAGTFALRLAVEKTETIGPSDHANQRNQVTSPRPAGAGLAGPAGTPCACRVLAGTTEGRAGRLARASRPLHRGLDREGKDSVDGGQARQGDDDGRLALHDGSTVVCTVGYCLGVEVLR